MAESPENPESPESRVVCDVMLGKLATYLRMCGVDAAYALDRGVEDDDAILELARREGRTLLTRDRELAARAGDSLLVESRDPTAQLAEVGDAGVDVSLPERPRRCGACNGELEPAAESPDIAPDDADVYRCRECGKHFWRGSHWAGLKARIEG